LKEIGISKHLKKEIKEKLIREFMKKEKSILIEKKLLYCLVLMILTSLISLVSSKNMNKNKDKRNYNNN
jgi:polyferredoxin